MFKIKKIGGKMIKLILKAISIVLVTFSMTIISTIASAEITINWPSSWVGKD